ncbi:Uracil-DNA glycosylase, partial [Bertholletia excelsa]
TVKPLTPEPSTSKPQIPKSREPAKSKKSSNRTRKHIQKVHFKPTNPIKGDEQITNPSASGQSPNVSLSLGNHEKYQPENLSGFKSCRRSLNFGFSLFDNEMEHGKNKTIVIHQYQQERKRVNRSSSGTHSILHCKETNESMVENSAGISFPQIRPPDHPCTTNQTGCQYNSLKVYQRRWWPNQCQQNSRILGPNFPRVCKKKRKLRQRKAIILPLCATAKVKKAKNDITILSHLRSIVIPKKGRTRRRGATNSKTWQSVEVTETEQNQIIEQLAPPLETSGCHIMIDKNFLRRKISLTKVQTLAVAAVNGPNSFNDVLSLPLVTTSKKKRSNNTTRRLNFDSLNVLPAVEDLAKRLKDLYISDKGSQLILQDSNPFSTDGENGAVILYDSKKQKVLCKVDIDQETMRVWKLLVANGPDYVDEERDEEKEKWWQEQREVLHCRVNSFIACMHAMQGDRRFSQWKGSVVDSVVGVFLTQNVSDHLSSSAFMSLAAKYPVQSATDEQQCNEDLEFTCSQESVGSNIGAMEQTLHADGKQSSVTATIEDMDQQLLENNIPEAKIAVSDEAGDRNVVHCEDLPHIVMGFSSDESPSSTCKLSPTKRSGDLSEILQLEEIDWLRESESFLEGKLSQSDRVGDFNISQEFKNGTQGSSANILLDLNDTHALLCSPTDPNPPSAQHAVELDCPQTVVDSTKTKMKDVENISKNFECLKSTDGETMTKQMVMPTVQESTGNQCASLSKCQLFTEYSSNEGKEGDNLSKKKQRGSKIIPQTQTLLKKKKTNLEGEPENKVDWDDLRKTYGTSRPRERTRHSIDSVNWEGVRKATTDEVADAIKGRGQHRVLAERIKDFLDRLVEDHGSIDLEWLRDVPPDKAKDYLLSFKGLGLKSVECVRLLALQHHAFPVDVHVARVAVRLGWVPLQPLPESLQLHLLEQYPQMDKVQIFLQPRLCTLPQHILYELHYQMITFGKVFCRKRNPNCNACPMKAECRHYASACASARLALPGSKKKRMVRSMVPIASTQNSSVVITPTSEPTLEDIFSEARYETKNCEPIIEHPPSPVPDIIEYLERDIEDFCAWPEDAIPTIRLETKKFEERNWELVKIDNVPLEESETSKALVTLNSQAASIPVPKLKAIGRLRTVHHVYELPDSHPILEELDKREADDPCPYLLAIWVSGEISYSLKPFKKQHDTSGLEVCNEDISCASNDVKDQNFQTVSGTILIPCRTATRGSFPLNGTYFQVNEVFADDETSQLPLLVPRAWIWNLPRRTLHCGANISAIFRGLSVEEIHNCFWRGFVCTRGFNRKTRAPVHLCERFHVSTTTTNGKRKFAEDDE